MVGFRYSRLSPRATVGLLPSLPLSFLGKVRRIIGVSKYAYGLPK